MRFKLRSFHHVGETSKSPFLTLSAGPALWIAALIALCTGASAQTAQFTTTVNPTAFGTVNIGSSSSVVTLTASFGIGGAIGLPAVLTQGAPGFDFQDAGTGTCTTNGTAHTYSSGDTCTVNLIFNPLSAGLRSGAVVLLSNSGTRIATQYIQGIGSGPQPAYLPGTLTTLPITVTSPAAIALDGNGNIYVANAAAVGNPNSVTKSSWNGTGYTTTTVLGNLYWPVGVAVDGAGNVFIADENGAVYKATPSATGYSATTIAGGLSTLTGLGVDASGNVYTGTVTGLYKSNPIQSNNGISYGLTKIDSATFAITSIVADVSSNLFVTSSGGPLYEEVLSGGTYTHTQVAATSGLGLAMDATGNLYTGYPFGNSVLKYTWSGSSYSQSTLLTLSGNVGRLALDSNANLYFIASGAGTIQKLDVSDPPTLIFAATAVGHTSTDSPKTVTLQNIGNASLTFPIPASDNNPSISTNFTLSSSGGTACPLVGSIAFSPGTLAANASCLLPISYQPTAATPLNGVLVLTDNAWNAAAPGYTTQQIALGVAGAGAAVPSVIWNTPAPISYGTLLSGVQLNATSSVAGTFVYSPAAGIILGVGTQTLSVTFTPTDTADYAPVTATTTLIVNQATPSITWATPSAITYGTALSATQLSATSPAAGTFTYTPVLGTVLSAATQTLSVTFTPTDTTDYTAATATTTIKVNPATPTITWPTPSAISYGAALSGTQLNATASTPGTFTYNPASGAVLTAGQRQLSVSFTPTDTTDYTTASSTATILVNTVPLTATGVSVSRAYGTANPTLTVTVTGAVNNDVFTTSAATPAISTTNVGSYNVIPSITGANIGSYSVTRVNGTLTITPATLTVVPQDATRIYAAANPTFPGTVTGAQNSDTFTVTGATTATTTSPVGPYSITYTVTGSKLTDYIVTPATGTLTITQATSTITWNAPAAITYGAALSTTQLNATASTPGTLTYNPASGTILSAGQHQLSVAFTPTDTTDYTTASSTTTISVNQAPLSITANNTARVFGSANPTFTGAVTGAVNGDTFTESFSTTATTASIIGTYPIVPAVTGTNLSNYAVTPTNGALTITQTGTATTFTLSNNNLTLTATVASLTSGTPTGTVAFYEGQTQIGSGTLSNGVATYTAGSFPSGDVVVSAQYSGDVNFTQSASPPIFQLALTPTLTSLTVAKTGTITDTLGVGVAPGYVGSVQFTCTGLPAGATCSFQPSTYSFTGSSSTTNITLTIQTSAIASLATPTPLHSNGHGLPMLAILGAPGLFALAFTMRKRKWNTRMQKLLMLLVLGAFSTALIACGSSTPSAPSVIQTPAGSSTVQVVTSGSGGLSLTTNLSLTVQ